MNSLKASAPSPTPAIPPNAASKVQDEWTEVPGYFDVTVWGKQGENIARYLGKGSGVVVRGELRWREWEDKEGNKRQATEINADEVQWLSGHDGPRENAPEKGRTDIPVDEEPPADFEYGGFAGAPSGPDDQIPF